MTTSGPYERGWDHRYKCMDRDKAEDSRDRLKASVGSTFNGKKVRWRIDQCRVCHKFCVVRDGSSRGDIAGQRKRAKERKRAARAASAVIH
jgi:hypothetical protein